MRRKNLPDLKASARIQQILLELEKLLKLKKKKKKLIKVIAGFDWWERVPALLLPFAMAYPPLASTIYRVLFNLRIN